MNVIKKIAFLLVIVGALNWGFVGIFGFDLVAFLLGEMTTASKIVYALVGLSAIIVIFSGPCCKEEEKSAYNAPSSDETPK